MKKEHLEWIKANEYLFTHATGTNRDTRTHVYTIYNETFNANKKPNGCGRCWQTVKKELYQKYLQHNV